jgi:hypothetical protein
MPNGQPRSGFSFRRHVAPFAPLALALLMSRAVLPPSPEETTEAATAAEAVSSAEPVAMRCGDEDIPSFQECHTRFPTGCSKAAGYDAYLNLLKNQLTPPPAPSDPMDYFTDLASYKTLEKSIPAGLTSRNHQTFKDDLGKAGEGQLHGIVGYLYYVQKTGAESSNCLLDGKGDPEGTDVDFHIGIGFDADTAKKVLGNKLPKGRLKRTLQMTSVVVEMTPHYRFSFENGIWTLENLQKAVGRQVKVVGQLLVDNEHNRDSDNCARTHADKARCWRASIWELHPITNFLVCNADSCTQDSANWVELDDPSLAIRSAGPQSGRGGLP